MTYFRGVVVKGTGLFWAGEGKFRRMSYSIRLVVLWCV